MSITVNIYYTGRDGSARKFAEEMVSSGIVSRVRAEEGNERYEYFFPMDDPETVLLIDRWRDEEAVRIHHKSEMMVEIAALRDKYRLHMRIERFTDAVRS
ncbi:MAG: antibiotic biosynthesis monooxygenase [Oscillospiraceae bacterium]|nr:antibiotic biosynthesis monooxygenase [Oscillospiraceae bacterium]MBQ8978516.1 antibiotic biosynthesis monooxygenase [Oscillospiraceae bacterium]